MKTCVRTGSLVAVLTLAGLLAGCVSSSPRTGAGGRPARDFEVVETSTKRNLTPKEMAQLRTMVGEYLKKEGVAEDGDYYVKVFLTPEREGVPAEWVVVRYSNPVVYTATRFSLLSSYPAYSSYDYPYSYLSYDYYPFPDYGFSRLSFQYYDYPYYPYYYPRHGHGGPDHRWHRPRDRKPDRDHDRPPGGHRPPGEPPRVTHRPRWETNSPERNGQPRENNFPARSDSRQSWRERNPGPGISGPSNPGRSQPPSRHDTSGRRDYTGRGRDYTPSSGTSAQDNRGTAGRSNPPSTQPATYTPPAPRSEPAPVYTPPATRSEPAPERSRPVNTNDGGRRARSE